MSVLIGNIREYDIEQCNINILKLNNIIDITEYTRLKNADKQYRVIAIGKMMKTDRRVYETINKDTNKYVSLFIKSNNIADENIIEINHDAIWTLNADVSNHQFDELIRFKSKNEFNILFTYKSIKFYYNTLTGIFDMRGVMNDVKRDNHFILDVIKNSLLYVMNKSSRLYKYLHTTRMNYVRDKRNGKIFRDVLTNKNVNKTEKDDNNFKILSSLIKNTIH